MKDRIFAVGYRRLPGERPRYWAPWPIARTALSLAWRRRSTKLGVALCGFGVFGHGMALGIQLLANRVLRGAEGPQGDLMSAMVTGVVGNAHSALANFIGVQLVLVALLLAIVGAGLIAEDRRTGAMELYFSRPLTRRDYIVGKVLAAGLVPVGLLVVPYLLLWLLAVGTAPPEAASTMLGLLLPGLAGSLLAAVLLTFTIVGVSALGERGRTVGALYFVGIVILNALGDSLPDLGYDAAGYLSPLRNIQTVVDAALGAGGSGMLLGMLTERPDTNASVLLALVCVVGLSAAGLGLLVWRVRQEVAG